MSSDNGHYGPAPTPADPRSTLRCTLEVDGEVFAIRDRDGGTDYEWISGRNEGYGFSSSGRADRPEAEHRRSIQSFLEMIDPATGYIAEP